MYLIEKYKTVFLWISIEANCQFSLSYTYTGNEYDVPVFISAIINEPATAQNKAYASVMEMNQNEAYGQVNNNLKTELEQQPHVYEELSPTVS